MPKQTSSKKLLDWYYINSKSYPFRENPLPYNIWISEIMLQQTRMQAVIPYYNEFLKRFPSIKELANAKEKTVLEFWKGLGYYNRARNIHKAAKIIIHNFDGCLPKNKEELLKLPGIGPYTASAISSIAYEGNEIVLDGNVKRIASRLFLIANDDKLKYEEKLKESIYSIAKQNKQQSSKQSNKIYGEINQALMDLGRELCHPKNPNCKNCPLFSICLAREKKITENYPLKKEKPKSTIVHLVFFLLETKAGFTRGIKNQSKNEILFKHHTKEAFLKNSFFPPYITFISSKYDEKKNLLKTSNITTNKLITKQYDILNTKKKNIKRIQLDRYNYIPEILKKYWNPENWKTVIDLQKLKDTNREGLFIPKINTHAITHHKIQVHIVRKFIPKKDLQSFEQNDPNYFSANCKILETKMLSSLGRKIYKSIYDL